MKYIRFLHEGKASYGILDEQGIRVLDRSYFQPGYSPTGLHLKLEDVKLLAPVEPGKIVCVGLNYSKHIAELGFAISDDPVIFLKPPSSVIGPGEEIHLPAMSQQVDYEGELAVIVGAEMGKVTPQEVPERIFGYTCGNDVTARDLQKKDGQWTRAKGFDTFCPLGPWIVSDLDNRELDIQALLNDQVRQSSNTRYLLRSVNELISFISHIMTLEPGDVILTGTPEGVGPMTAGDEIRVEIQGIGSLSNRVRKEF